MAGLVLGVAIPAQATPVTSPGAPVNLNVKPGDTVNVGYDFTVPGNKATVSVRWTSVVASLAYTCAGPGGASGTLTTSLPDSTTTVTDDKWYPSDAPSSSFQGSLTVPAACGTGTAYKVAVSFTGDASSDPAPLKVNFRFHAAVNSTNAGFGGTASVTTSAIAQPTQTIQAEIYNCANGSPTTTLASGGTLAVPSASLSSANPLVPTNVSAGAFTVNATAPSGQQFVACGASGVSGVGSGSASQSTTVASGGAGNAIFYVAAIPSQTIQGEIYQCVNGSPTTTLATGGTIAVPSSLSSANPLAATKVSAGTYTVNATAGSGQQFAACGASGVTGIGSGSASQSTTVPSGGAGDAKFYTVAIPTQTIQGEIYNCTNGSPTTTLASGGTVAVSSASLSSANPLAASKVNAGTYTVTATAPSGQQFVACGGSGVTGVGTASASQSTTVPSGGAGDAKFYVQPIPVITQTIQGEIYDCTNGAPTTTLASGGTVAVGSAGLSHANPLPATNVAAGTYTVSATAPSGDQFVACGGSGVTGVGTASASQSSAVPAGGAGDAKFYVQTIPVITQTIQGEIYDCTNGAPTTTLAPGGTVAVSSAGLNHANPLSATNVAAGTYTVTATAPGGQQFVACGGSGVAGVGTGNASQSTTVPSGGAGDAKFYVQPIPVTTTQTIQGEIYNCANGAATTTLVAGGTVAVTSAGLSHANPLPATKVDAGTYTVTATAPTGQAFVACGGSGVTGVGSESASQSTTVPSSGAGDAKFYVAAIPANTQTIQAEIYNCANGSPSATLASGGSIAVVGGPSSGNPLAATQIKAGTYTVNATAPAGEQFIACGRTGVTGVGTGSASRSATVPANGAANATFYVQPIPVVAYGYIKICQSSANFVTGSFTFTVGGIKHTIQAGTCTASLKVKAGTQTVQQTPPAGLGLVKGSSSPSLRLIGVSSSLHTITVHVIEGTSATHTTVTFVDKHLTGKLRICAVGGTGVSRTATFGYTISAISGSTATVSGTLRVPAGACRTLTTNFRQAQLISVQQSIPRGYKVSSIHVGPAGRLVNTPNLGAGKAWLMIGSGVTTVTFTDRKS